MKSIEQSEIDRATFQINAPKRHTHANERRLTRCVQLVRDGGTLDGACQDVFGRVNDVLKQDIIEAINKQTRGENIERKQSISKARPQSESVDFRRVRNA